MGNKLRTYIFVVIFTFCNGISKINANPLMGEKVEPANANEFPFIVSLGHLVPSCLPSERYRHHFCTGSLITKRHVLTAAHCIIGEKLKDVVVSVGSIDLNEGPRYRIESWKTYDDWTIENNILSETAANDIAIVKLRREVPDIVPAIRSNLPESKVFGKNVVTAGWGLLVDLTKPRFLQKASLKILTENECKNKILIQFGTKSFLTSKNHYCTTARPPLLLGCGDSGGPLLLSETKEIVGVNEGACEADDNDITHPDVMNIHSKVNYYKEFIDDTIKQ